MKVIKRDGRVGVFDKKLIENAINKSAKEIGIEDNVGVGVSILIEDILKTRDTKTIDIEDLQDMVIEALSCKNLDTVAKSYKDYRDKRSRQRDSNGEIFKNIEGIIDGSNKKTLNENGNKKGELINVQRDLIAGEVSKAIARKSIPKDCIEANDRGVIKIHDMDYWSSKSYNCELFNLKDMLEGGTVINGKLIEKPKSLRTAVTVASQISACIASSTYGGQTMSISHLAPYVRISEERIVKEEMEIFEERKNRLKEQYIDEEEEIVRNTIQERLRAEIKDSIQTFSYQINTLSSGNGQSPFSSLELWINAEPEYRRETVLLIEEVLRQRKLGIKNENGVYETPAFPKLLYILDENNIYEESDYFWLTKKVAECCSLRMNPDFISAKMMRERIGAVYPCMGCVDKHEVITYKYQDVLYVESFERMWDRFSKIYEVKEQKAKGNFYIETSGKVEIYDKKNGFVYVNKIIKNKDKGNWKTVVFTNGRVLTATGDHPLPIEGKGRVLLDELEIGDKVQINQTQYSKNDIDFDIDLAWLLGFVLCDGSYSQGVFSSIALDSENDIEDFYKKTMDKNFNVKTRTVEQHRGQKGSYKDLISSGEGVIELKKYLESIFGGKQKIYRQIPNEVFSWKRESKMSFLAGMLDADGYVNDRRNSLCQLGGVNKEMAIQTMLLAQSVGLRGKEYINHYSKDKSKVRYRIEFPCTSEFIAYSKSEKKKFHFKKDYNVKMSDYSEVKSIEEIGFRNEYSYDVETSSDYFDVSGIYSHNCRAFLSPMKDKNGNIIDDFWGRGNNGVTTLNLPYIALESLREGLDFYTVLDKYLEMVQRVGELRWKKLEGVTTEVAPILWEHGAIARAKKGSKIVDIMKERGFTTTIGFSGIWETVYALTGKRTTEPEGFKKADEILAYIEQTKENWNKEKPDMRWAVYATPQESTTDTFAKALKREFGVIPHVSDRDFVTNGFHIHVEEPIDAFEKLSIEGELQKHVLGGTVSYVEVDNLSKNVPALIKIMQHIYEKIQYAEINFEGDICNKCMFKGAMLRDEVNNKWICPNCGNDNQDTITVTRRLCGYLNSSKEWSNGRLKDILSRVKHL